MLEKPERDTTLPKSFGIILAVIFVVLILNSLGNRRNDSSPESNGNPSRRLEKEIFVPIHSFTSKEELTESEMGECQYEIRQFLSGIPDHNITKLMNYYQEDVDRLAGPDQEKFLDSYSEAYVMMVTEILIEHLRREGHESDFRYE